MGIASFKLCWTKLSKLLGCTMLLVDPGLIMKMPVLKQ